MTPGIRILIQQIHLVAVARGWGSEKVVKKLKDAIALIEKSAKIVQEQEAKQAAASAAPEMAMDAKEQKLVASAEKFLKDLLKPSDAGEDDAEKTEQEGTLPPNISPPSTETP